MLACTRTLHGISEKYIMQPFKHLLLVLHLGTFEIKNVTFAEYIVYLERLIQNENMAADIPQLFVVIGVITKLVHVYLEIHHLL